MTDPRFHTGADWQQIAEFEGTHKHGGYTADLHHRPSEGGYIIRFYGVSTNRSMTVYKADNEAAGKAFMVQVSKWARADQAITDRALARKGAAS